MRLAVTLDLILFDKMVYFVFAIQLEMVREKCKKFGLFSQV